MVNRKILNNVLRKITAGKEDIPESAPVPGAAPTAPDSLSMATPTQGADKPVNRKWYYYYSAPPTMSINFQSLTTILNDKGNDAQRISLIKKLEGGNSGKWHADYFAWKKLAVTTTQYSNDGKSLTIYEVTLNPDGTKLVGSDNVYPQESSVTADVFENDIGIFTGKYNTVTIDNSADALFYNYSDRDPPSNLIQSLLGGGVPPYNSDQKPGNYGNFQSIFNEFRIFSKNMNKLFRPDYTIPNNDGVPSGYYTGGAEAFNQVAGPAINDLEQKKESQPQEQSLRDKSKEQPSSSKSPFDPVDEQSKDRVRGDNLDKPSGSPMDTNKRFSSDSLKFKRMARRVVAEYFEDKAVDSAMSMSQTGTGSGGSGEFEDKSKAHSEISTQYKSIKDTDKSKAHDDISKGYKDMANMMNKFKRNEVNA